MLLTHFLPLNSSLDANSATDTFCSSLTSCLDTFYPLSSRPAPTTPSAPWLSNVLREHHYKLRAAERVWRKSQNPTDLNLYQPLLSEFSANLSTAKRAYYHDKLIIRLTLASSLKHFPPSFRSISLQIGPSKYLGEVRCPSRNI